MARINTPLRNYFFYKLGDMTGQVLTDGYLKFYKESEYPATLLTVYQDAALTIPYTLNAQNGVGLYSDGGIPPIYMQDEAYAIECYSVEDDLQFTDRNYEGAIFTPGGSGGDSTKTPNLFPDGQFNFPIYDGITTIGVTPITSTDWVFAKDGSGGTDILEFIRFPLGDTDVVQTPLNMLHYQVTSSPSGETTKRLYFPFRYARTLESEQVTISFYARGTGSSMITPFYEQYFGSGGSPSLTNTVDLTPISLTGTWTEYQQTFTIDSAGGKNLGSNDDDQLRVGIEFSINGLTNVYLTNMLLEESDTATQYPYVPNNEIESQQNSVNPPGMISAFGRYTAPVGWLECETPAAIVSRTTYIDLFQATSITLNGDTSNGSDVVSNVNTAKLAGGSYITQTATTTAGTGVITGLTGALSLLAIGMRVSCSDYSTLATIASVDSDVQVTVTGATGVAGGSDAIYFYYNLGTEFTCTGFTGVVSILRKINATSYQASAKATASGTTGILFYAYGGGDGTTTFTLPTGGQAMAAIGGDDLNIISNGLGAYGGFLEKKIPLSQMPAHTHSVPTSYQTGGGSLPNTFVTSVGATYGPIDTLSTGGGEAFWTLPPTRRHLMCIKT